MRVLVLNQYGLPRGAAGITRHGDIGAELAKRGHQVTVIASAFDYLTRSDAIRSPGESCFDGVRFIWLRTGSYAANDLRRVRSMLRYTASGTRAAIMHRPRPDVIVGSSPHLLTGLASAAAARLLRIPWVLEVRDLWPSSLVDLGAIRTGSLTHRALERLEKALYRWADRIVMVPPRGSTRLAELGLSTSRCVHIPNAATAPPAGAPCAQHPREPSEVTIVYAGAHGVTNQLMTVLDAAEALRAHYPDVYNRVRIELVGDGQERDRLVKAATQRSLKRVHMRPAVPKQAVAQLLAGADIGLLNLAGADVFKYGLSPNKLFDYFAAGLPVLISAEHPTLVDEINAGIRYRPGDPQALAEAIVTMVNMPAAQRTRMGERGRRLVQTSYSIEAITDRYESLLEELVTEHRR